MADPTFSNPIKVEADRPFAGSAIADRTRFGTQQRIIQKAKHLLGQQELFCHSWIESPSGFCMLAQIIASLCASLNTDSGMADALPIASPRCRPFGVGLFSLG